MIEIYPLRFTKDKLNLVPREEQIFHMLIAQISNEILILNKQTLLSSNALGDGEMTDAAAVTSAHLNLRLLAGRLYEGWKLLKTPEAGKAHQSFLPSLDNGATAARKTIMKYFATKKNIVQILRQKSAFHWDYQSAAAAYDAMPSDLELVDYISFERGNSLYYSGALLHAGQMTELVGRTDVGEALSIIHNEVTNIASEFQPYADGVMVAFMERHTPLSKELFSRIRVEMQNQPDIQQAKMPYFLDTASVHRDLATQAVDRRRSGPPRNRS